MELDGKVGSGAEYVLLGVAAGASFALLLLNMDYFVSLHPAGHIEFSLAFVYKLSSLAAALSLMACAAIPLRARLMVGLLSQAALAYTVTFVSGFHSLFGVVMALGAAQSLTQTSLFGWCCQQGTDSKGVEVEGQLQRVFLGLGLSGVLSGALKVVSKIYEPDPRKSALHMGAGMAMLCLFALAAVCSGSRTKELRPAMAPKEVSEMLNHAKRVWPALGLLAASLAMSMLLFPGLTTNIHSAMPWWHAWFHVILYVTFLFFDVAGRVYVPNWSVVSLLKLCGARIVFLPLFLLLSHNRGEWVDVLSVLAVAALAASNGFLVSSAAKLAPRLSPGREATGMLIAIAALVGQTAGLCCAFMLRPASAPLHPAHLSLLPEKFSESLVPLVLP